MLEDTIALYLSRINYHNMLVEDIDFQTYFFDGKSPIATIRELKVEIKKLEQYIPKDVIEKAPKLLEWTPDRIKSLKDEELSKAWLAMDKQIEKIKDFCKMGSYIQYNLPWFNFPITLLTMTNNFSKLSRNYTKKSGDDTTYLYKDLKQLIQDAQFANPTKKEKEDHAGFEVLKAKYPQFDFGPREFSQAEKDVEHLRVDINVGHRGHVDIQDEKSLKEKIKNTKPKKKK